MLFPQQFVMQSDCNGEPVVNTMHLQMRKEFRVSTAAGRGPLAHEVLHWLGLRPSFQPPHIYALECQVAATRPFFSSLKCPLTLLRPAFTGTAASSTQLWLFLFLGVNFHLSSPNWDTPSSRKPSLKPRSRSAPRVCSHSNAHPLHFTWLKWPASCLFIKYFPGGQTVRRLPTMWETRVRSLGQEDPLEKEMAPHSSTLAWKIPWMEEPGRLHYSPRGRKESDTTERLHLLSLCLLSLDSELPSAGIWWFCYCGTPSRTKSRTSTNNWLANRKMSKGVRGDENTPVGVIDRQLLISVRHREEL